MGKGEPCPPSRNAALRFAFLLPPAGGMSEAKTSAGNSVQQNEAYGGKGVPSGHFAEGETDPK